VLILLNYFPIFLLLNVLPVFVFNQQNPDNARIYGIPFAYISAIIFGLLTFAHIVLLRNKLIVDKTERSLILALFIFVIYVILQFYIVDSLIDGVVNILSIIFYIALFLSIVYLSKNMDEIKLRRLINRCNYVLLFGITIGCVKYIIGISEDSNFFVYFNRNATALILLLFFSLYSYYNRYERFYLHVIIIYLIFFLLLESRAGIIGFVIVNSTLFLKFRLKNLLIIIFSSLLFIIVLSSGLGHDISKRLDRMSNSFETLLSHENLDSAQNDYRRVMLVYSGIDIIKDNYLWGTGIGSANYLRFFDEVKFPTIPGQPHNFYLSYPAQMGIVGFSIFILILYLSFYRIFKFGGRSGKSFVIILFFYLTFNEYILLPEVWILSAFFVAIIKRENNHERV